MPTPTANLGLAKPTYLVDSGAIWTAALNADLDLIDASIFALKNKSTPQILTALSSTMLDFSSGESKVISLTTNVTLSVANQVDGTTLNMLIKCPVGGFSLTWPSNFNNAIGINSANSNNFAGTVLSQSWRYDLAANTWYAKTPLTY